MGSRYSEKRQSAVCNYGRCEEPGTKLGNFSGALDWYCEFHYKQLQEAQ